MRTHETEGFYPASYAEGSITAVASGLPDNLALRTAKLVSIYFSVTGAGAFVRIQMAGTPTATVGRPIYDGDEKLFSKAEAERLSMILGTGAASATWRAHYYLPM